MPRTKLYVPPGSDAGGDWVAQWVLLGESPAYNKYVQEVLADNPVSYWRLENDLTDSSGSNDLTNSGAAATFGSGLLGASGAHKNGGSKSTLPTVVSTAVNNMSIEFWCDYDGIATNQHPVYNGNNSTNGYGFRIGDGAGGTGTTAQILVGGLNWNALSSTVTFPTGITHVVMMRDAGTWRLYFNAVQQATGTQAPNTPDNSASYGGFYIDGSNAFEVDEVAFYNSVLSPSRIQAHYDARTGV